jgi:hypothetical protein
MVAALALLALGLWLRPGMLPAERGAAAGRPAPPVDRPRIQGAELRLATSPAPGVWAELKVILDNPLPAGPLGPATTVLLVPATVLEDFAIRSTEPPLLGAPRRRADGRYALLFPAPLAQTLTWYRVHLTLRTGTPRPVRVAVLLDRPLLETRPVRPEVIYADREADPFGVVPEPLVGWLPGQSAGAFRLLLAYAAGLAVIVVAGCLAAFGALRSQPPA